MNKADIKKLKEYLSEMDPDIKFDEKNEDKLIGYAEQFGGTVVPMYEGVNTFLSDHPDGILDIVFKTNPEARKTDGFEDTIIGYIYIDDKPIILHDRDKMIDKMIEEYTYDQDLEEEEGYIYYVMAMEHYQHNIIGTYMRGVPAYAVREDW